MTNKIPLKTGLRGYLTKVFKIIKCTIMLLLVSEAFTLKLDDWSTFHRMSVTPTGEERGEASYK